ncbi:hypothetical protein [Microbacterium sp. YJN-G]|uniref:hypothetical protein n=1 Tax=Microbacterium sp. YJN-G TaxID=2763257 RepID=UPI001877D0F4|nr:hypothetical protein [Microbacterium sp. YJN-G]
MGSAGIAGAGDGGTGAGCEPVAGNTDAVAAEPCGAPAAEGAPYAGWGGLSWKGCGGRP